ncbi:MAG: type III pantothenate kinase [Verrucomicrobia bacterium]|nr:MAG: type III pantothenate kinase [Verrucomicrobiota bacterium]
MIILFDIGNTHTHIGLADAHRVVRHTDIRTEEWVEGSAKKRVSKFAGGKHLSGAILCSVVPRATPYVLNVVRDLCSLSCVQLTHKNVTGIGIDYPKPRTIGADRLANSVAAKHHFGAPVVVVDFGTAVTFDVVNRAGDYVGGIIAPGLAAMTDYLHEKTALLPRIRVREVRRVVGKSTQEAMLIGAVKGYRGLVRELILELRRELKVSRLPVVATGGYADLIGSRLPEIVAIEPELTLEGLRLSWENVRREA